MLSFGQVIDHFSNSDSRWNVADTYPNANQQNPNFVETRTTIFGFVGDTVVNGKTWLKLYSSNDSLLSANLNFEGYIYSDANLVLKTDTNFQIDTIYKFDLSVGDSINFDFGFYSEYIPVVNIDSIQINNQYHKRFHFAEPTGPSAFTVFNEKWIEGIGSIHGPLFPLQPELFSTETPDSLTLVCTKSNGNNVWQHKSYNNCIINIVLSIDKNELISFKIFPNPFQNEITFICNDLELKELFIYNELGQEVIVNSWNDSNNKIDLRSLKNGIYFLTLKVNNRSETMKLIKNN